MVNQKIFVRLGKTEKGAFKADANIKQNISPIWSNTNVRTKKALPTVHFAIEVDIPDAKFDMEKVAVAKINFELEEERLMVKAVDSI